MAYHDVECPNGHYTRRARFPLSHTGYSIPCPVPDCGLDAPIVWRPSSPHDSFVHTSERAVVYRHPVTGHVEFPMRNDVPMPARYRKWGYERVEASSLRELHSIERASNTRNERAWFDRGSGRNFDGADC